MQNVCLERQISEQSFYRWRRELGMLEINKAKQPKEFQRENTRLKRMLANKMPGLQIHLSLGFIMAQFPRKSANKQPTGINVSSTKLLTTPPHEVHSKKGYDSFLLEPDLYHAIICAFLGDS
ncbi:transposase [bacterium]|nr:transposase [bacterium]